MNDYASTPQATPLESQNSVDSLQESTGADGHQKHHKEVKDRYAHPKVKCTLPNHTENNLTKARLFSFEQLYEFNNLFLNKSFLRKRVRATEVDIDKE